jgi:hypothetical protein
MKQTFITLLLSATFLMPTYGAFETTLRKEISTNNSNANSIIFGVRPFPYEPYPTLVLDLPTTEYQPICVNEEDGEVSCEVSYSYNGNLKKEKLHTTNYKCASNASCDPKRGRRCTEVQRGKQLSIKLSHAKLSCTAHVTYCTCKKYGDPNSFDKY